MELALPLQFAKSLEQQVVVCFGGIANVVALQRSDALGQRFLLGGHDDLFHGIQGQAGDDGFGVIQKAFLDDAVGLAVGIHPDQIAILGRGLPVQADGPQSGAVQHTDVEAGPHDHHRHIGGNGIQVRPGGKAFFAFGEIVLVPAFPFQPSGVLGVAGGHGLGHALLDLLDGADACQADAAQAFGKVDEMHMGIVEPGQHQPAFHVHRLIGGPPAGQLHLGAPFTAHEDEAAVLHQSGRGQRAVVIHGVDVGVADEKKHGLFLLSWDWRQSASECSLSTINDVGPEGK